MLILNDTHTTLMYDSRILPPGAGYDWNNHVFDRTEITSVDGSVEVISEYDQCKLNCTGSLVGEVRELDNMRIVKITKK